MKGESVPKKTESTSADLNSYLDKLLDQGSRSGSVTEDDIQIALKDVDVSDAQLNSVYRSLRDHGIEVISASGDDDDTSLDIGDSDVLDDDELGDESIEDHEIKVAKNADAEMASARTKRKSRVRTSRSRSRARFFALFVLRAAQRFRLPPEERLRHLPVRLRRRLAQRPGEQQRQKRHRHDRRPDRPRPLFPASRAAWHAFFLFCAHRANFMRFGLTSAGKIRIMNVAALAPTSGRGSAAEKAGRVRPGGVGETSKPHTCTRSSAG